MKTQNSNQKISKRVFIKRSKSYRELLFCQHCQVQELRSELPCFQITKKTIVKTLIPFPPFRLLFCIYKIKDQILKNPNKQKAKLYKKNECLDKFMVTQ